MMYLKRGQRVGPGGFENPYFKRKPIVPKTGWDYYRKRGRTILSKDAQLKLEWIIFYFTVGNYHATKTAQHFGVTRKTLHKWLKRFDTRNLSALEEHRRTPILKRQWGVLREEEANIISLRKKNMEYGKKKLQVLYLREFGITISTWKIERVIRRYNLFPEKEKHQYKVKKRGKQHSKMRIHTIKEQLKKNTEFGFLWHIDTVVVWWYGERRTILTAIEDRTKIAYARVYKTNTTSYTKDFLERLMYLVEGKVSIMHSDNGSEFQGLFEQTCKQLTIQQIYSRPHTPKDNPALERFNNTIQYEWLKYSEVGLDDIAEANRELTTWLVKYNSYRPHETLDYKTPLEYAQEQFFKVLPMWSARTQA
jgi:transposase InsO family protein/transposase-like protein